MATRAQIIIPIAAAAFIVGIVGVLNIPSDAKLGSIEFPMGTIKLDNEILQVPNCRDKRIKGERIIMEL